MLVSSIAAVGAAMLLVAPVAGQSNAFCESGQVPHFVLGFAALRDGVGDTMGEPIECEHANPENGDALQHTTRGLSFYRKSTNTPTFTDGFNHVALTAEGIVAWTGSSVDPPGVMVPSHNPTQAPAPTLAPTFLPAEVTPAPTPLSTPAVTVTPASTLATATPTPAASSAAPTATPTLAPAFGSRGNPISRGSPGQLPDAWSVLVVSVTSNATETVLAQNQLNEPPMPGEQFVIARIQATNTGPGSARLGARFRLRATGDAGESYSTFENGCRVIPDEITDVEVPAGATIGGNVCWSIRSSDVNSLLMYDSPSTMRHGPATYFLLH